MFTYNLVSFLESVLVNTKYLKLNEWHDKLLVLGEVLQVREFSLI